MRIIVLLSPDSLTGASYRTRRPQSVKPSAGITGMNIQDVNLTDATMLFDVKVDNPYMMPLPLGNLDYALASQGQQSLTGNADVQGTIPASASKTLPIPIKINYLKLFNAVRCTLRL